MSKEKWVKTKDGQTCLARQYNKGCAPVDNLVTSIALELSVIGSITRTTTEMITQFGDIADGDWFVLGDDDKLHCYSGEAFDRYFDSNNNNNNNKGK